MKDQVWSSSPLDDEADRALSSLEAGMRVSLISTTNMITCRAEEQLADVLHRPETKQFDHIPVYEGDSIAGVLDRKADHKEAAVVGEAMRRLHESILISAESSLLTFIEDADRQPCRLLIEGRRIVGIVTLSDLQKLAVRPVLFSLITHLELLLADWIRHKVPEADWFPRLSEGRRVKIQEKWDLYSTQDLAIDMMSCTDFCDKRDLALKLRAFTSKRSAENNLKLVERVRDSVAHAGDYALTVEKARAVAEMVRSARWLIKDLRRHRQPPTETIEST